MFFGGVGAGAQTFFFLMSRSLKKKNMWSRSRSLNFFIGGVGAGVKNLFEESEIFSEEPESEPESIFFFLSLESFYICTFCI